MLIDSRVYSYCFSLCHHLAYVTCQTRYHPTLCRSNAVPVNEKLFCMMTSLASVQNRNSGHSVSLISRMYDLAEMLLLSCDLQRLSIRSLLVERQSMCSEAMAIYHDKRAGSRRRCAILSLISVCLDG